MLRVVFRSYGGENLKGRPAFYSKRLAFDSFERAYLHAREHLGGGGRPPGSGQGIDLTFANDGPIDEAYLSRMRDLGRIVQTDDGPVGPKASYTFALNLPDTRGWSDDDVVVYIEDDYLLTQDALLALAQAVEELPQAGYFALAHGRPQDLTDAAQIARYGTVPWWRPAPDVVVQGRTWINILGVTSTFAARVHALREDKDIFMLCQQPFRKRWYDHETAMLYQGVVPYRGTSYFTGMPRDFVPSVRGVLRATYLLPFRLRLNARARRQRTPHLLYAPAPTVAVHMEVADLDEPQRWEDEAAAVADWSARRATTA